VLKRFVTTAIAFRPFSCYVLRLPRYLFTTASEMDTEAKAPALSFEDEFPTVREYCEKNPDKKYSTVTKYIRNGRIALHQFSGETWPRISATEANQVLASIKRFYTSPDIRVIHHDRKVDLFA
jgi:hypothetical protein